jgi:hypothetical protein
MDLPLEDAPGAAGPTHFVIVQVTVPNSNSQGGQKSNSTAR